MTTGSFRYQRFVIAFITLLALFLFIVVATIISQHNVMMEEIRSDAEHELELIGSFSREALLSMDYAEVEQFLHQWADEHSEILKIRAVAPNNFELVNFRRASASESSLDLSLMVRYEGRELIYLEMTKDLSPSQQRMTRISMPLVIGSVALIAVFGILLWYVMRKLALLPMEKEIEMRRQAEKKFRILLESAPDAMIFIDRDGRIIMVNSQTEVLFGYTKAGLEGRAVELLIPKRFRDRHHQFREQYIVRPDPRPMGLNLELFGLKKDGSEFPADISLSPVEMDDKLFILISIRDVTDRKRSERKIRKNYNFQSAISSILRIALEPVSLQDQLQRILDTILAIPDLSRESMGCIYLTEGDPPSLVMTAQRSLPDSTLKSCSSVQFSQCLCGTAASSQKIIFSECDDSRHAIHPEYAKDFPHSHYCVPILSGQETLGVINLVVKIGHKRSDDEEQLLTAVANTLAGIIEHTRTETDRLDLQDKLAHSEKLTALGRLTANVAHEIRTPLTLIGGFVRRLQRNINGDPKNREYSEIIITEVNRLEKILTSVLTFSSMPSLQVSSQDINDILNESLNAFQDQCSRQNIQIQRSHSEVPPVSVDRDQVKGVFSNILSNAVDSMPEGGTLTVTTEKSELNNKPWVVVDIADTGEGIPKDKLDTIFEPFYSTKILGHGTGLGLSISKKIMEDHGGYISVESSVGQGTAFHLHFPHDVSSNS